MDRIFNEYVAAVGYGSLRLLFVEDNEPDAMLMLEHLRGLPVSVEHQLAATKDEVCTALDSAEWDIIVSDFYLPGFDALMVLDELERRESEVPLVVVSGRVGEENAVAALKRGATDFVAKDRLMLLPASIARSLRETFLSRERRAADVARRLSDARFRGIVETASEGVWVLDPRGKTTYANSTLAEMLGVRVEAIYDASVDQLLRVVAGASLPSVVLLTGRRERREFELVRPDAVPAWAIVSCSVLPGVDGAVGGYLLMVTETTEQRNLQAQLLMADRMAAVGLLAAGVAHEINNPLAVALANLDLIIRDAELLHQESASDVTEGLREQAQDARTAAQRVAAIVKDLRAFSRTENEDVVPVDVGPVVESCVRMAAHELRHHASLVLDLDSVPAVAANEARLSQVVLNLLVNAAQSFSEADDREKQITVTTRLVGDRVAIAVRDTGVGIPPDAMSRLFTPFYTTKPVGVGTGLGLAISDRIVRSWEGEIKVESRVGEGTTFTVYLMRSAGRLELLAPIPSTVPDSRRRARILVVDDEASIRKTIYRALCDRHDVILASGPQQALVELATQDFDQILCDIMMPEMTGPELFERMRAERPEVASRFLFLSGGALNARLQAFLEITAGARVLEKPFSIHTLLKFVERHLPS